MIAAAAAASTASRSLICSGATLIVCPVSLVYQWQSELESHAPHLRVLIYDGDADVTCTEMATHDVVLTTSHVLAKQVFYNYEVTYQLRRDKKYE